MEAATEVQLGSDEALAKAKKLEKHEFFKQSRAVAKKWRDQDRGVGVRTRAAPVIKAKFKAALARGADM